MGSEMEAGATAQRSGLTVLDKALPLSNRTGPPQETANVRIQATQKANAILPKSLKMF